jgi:hypothetical protein
MSFQKLNAEQEVTMGLKTKLSLGMLLLAAPFFLAPSRPAAQAGPKQAIEESKCQKQCQWDYNLCVGDCLKFSDDTAYKNCGKECSKTAEECKKNCP